MPNGAIKNAYLLIIEKRITVQIARSIFLNVLFVKTRKVLCEIAHFQVQLFISAYFCLNFCIEIKQAVLRGISRAN